jgi:hypothetical protein
VSTQTPKETHFFSYPEVSNTYYDVKYIKTMENYELSFSSSENIKMDFSPSYLRYFNCSIPRIKQYDPDSYIVIILRNPAKRAVSHYQMDVRLGYQIQSLEKAYRLDSFWKEYIQNSLYYEAVKEFYKNFNNVFSICYEELFWEQSGLDKLADFLKIPEVSNFPIRDKKLNVFANPKSKTIIYLLRKTKVIVLLKFMLPSSFWQKLKAAFFSNNKRTKIDNNFLNPVFSKDISDLEVGFPHLNCSKYWNRKVEKN